MKLVKKKVVFKKPKLDLKKKTLTLTKKTWKPKNSTKS